jgi:GNAT superfamily N-acetyltransferase
VLALHLERVRILPPDLDELIALSLGENFPAIQVMRDEFLSGINRFEAAGEAMYVARAGERLAAIGGVNRDPYSPDPALARLRRLYVRPEFRRQAVARRLVTRLLEHARTSFDRVRLRTLREDADRFYVAIGFERVAGDPHATHSMVLGSASC